MQSGSSGGAVASRPGYEVLTAPKDLGGEVVALGPTASDGVFIVYILGKGFKYVDMSGRGTSWSGVAAFSGPLASELGLFHHVQGDAAFVSFAEAPARSWACFRLPAPGNLAKDGCKAELVGRVTTLPGEIQAACADPGDDAAAIALASGQVRFVDLHEGQAAWKGLKFDLKGAGKGIALTRLAPERAALVASGRLEFFVVMLDKQAKRAVLQLRGTLKTGTPDALGPLLGIAQTTSESQLGKDTILLCWGSKASETGSSELTFASATLDCKAASMAVFSPSEPAKALQKCWSCTSGYLLEWSMFKEGSLKMSIRDARYGIMVHSGEMALASSKPAGITAVTSGSVTLLCSKKSFAAVRLSLPKFSLRMVIGSKAPVKKGDEKLLPLREVVCGKRKRDDPEAVELFSEKRRVTSEALFVKELKQRLWQPSHELVDAIIFHRSWAAGAALLAQPDFDDSLAVRLLAAHPAFLARVVRRCRAPQQLDLALRDHLPESSLKSILEVLLDWLAAYRDFPEKVVQAAAPGMPSQPEIISFLRALADGCLPSLARLDPDTLERVMEMIVSVQADMARSERLYGAAREAFRQKKPLSAVRLAPALEVQVLPF